MHAAKRSLILKRNADGEYLKPNWTDKPDKIDWHYYVDANLRRIWSGFTEDQKKAIYGNASRLATDAIAAHYRFG